MPQKYHPSFIPDGDTSQQFTTKLSADEEKKFQDWVKTNKIPGADEPNFGNYDMRGFWKENPNFQHKEGEHFPDTYKQPGHETFSVESKYAKGRTDAGRWEGDTFIPPSKKSNSKYHLDFIPDNTDQTDKTDNGPSTFSRLSSGVSNWINEHPSVRRAIHGSTPEEIADKIPNWERTGITITKHMREHPEDYGIGGSYLGAPERGIITHKGKDIGTAFDELRNRNTDLYAGHPWKAAGWSLATEPARFLTELANDPFVLASGGPGRLFSKAGGLFGDLKAARARVPQVTDLGNVAPEGQKLLGAGPRFQAEPVEGEIVSDVADTTAGQSLPIRRSREIPYRPTTDIVSGDISPVKTEPFPYRTPQPEVPTGQLLRSFSTAYGDTPRAIEARKRFAEQASRQPITDESRMLTEGVRQPKSEDLIINEEGNLPGEMSRSEALMYEPEFKPWRGLSNLSEAILGRDILKRDVEAGKDPFRGPIDWGPIANGNTDETALTASRPVGEKKPTAKFRAWQQTGLSDIPDFPLYDVEGGPSHGTTTDVEGLKKLGIDVPETSPNPHAQGVDEPQFSKVLNFPNKGNVPERLQAAKFVTEIADDRYNSALAKYNSGRMPKEELDVIKADRDKALAEHSRLVEQSKGIASKQVEEPSFAKQGEGKIAIGADVKSLGKVLGTSLYKGDIAPIATKELLQNSVDAIRHLGEDGEIHVTLHPVQNYLEVSDNGKGMTRQELESVFTDLGASGKRSDEEAVGGFGLAKAAPLLGGEKSKITSVAKDPKTGKLMEHSFSGTPDQLLEGVDITSREVPEGTPTGTRVKVHVKPNSDFWSAKQFTENLTTSSRDIKGKIKVAEIYGDRNPEPYDYRELPKGESKILAQIKGKSANTTISIPSTSENKTRSYTRLHLSNNGMYQKTKEFYFDHEVPNAPSDIVIDVKSKVPEGHTDYPFTANREELRGSVEEQVKKYINENIVVPSVNKRAKELQQLYDKMPEISVGGGKFPNTFGRKIAVHDPGNRFTPEEFKQITSSPIFHVIANDIAKIIDSVMSSVKSKTSPIWIDRLEKVGISFDPGLHGVHIPNPKTGKSMILINPFQSMLTSTVDEAAGNIVHTILHEVAHVNPGIRGHNEAFTINLGEIYNAFGARKEVDALDKVTKSISTDSGEYHPELQEILQRYKESRGREATTEDLLTGTGIKSEVGKGSKGNIPPGGKPNGEGTTQSAVNKLLNALSEARGSAEEQAQKLKIERARRFAASAGVKAEGMAGAAKSLGKMRGEYEKIELPDHLQLTKAETDQLFTAIKKANITEAEKVGARSTLFRLIEGGNTPSRSELARLDSVFGGGFSDKIIEMQGGLGAINIKIGKTANTMKALMGSVDVSAPFRQGLGLIHKPEWRDAFTEMFKYFGDKKYYEAAMQQLESRPTYLLGREAGLFLAKPGTLLASEELFMNNYINHLKGIPGLNIAPELVEASERAYSGFLNKLRADVFDSLIKEAKAAGHEAFTVAEQETEDGIKKIIVPSKTTENIAKFINNATGRGNLGKLEKMAPELNAIIWSPRLIASRLTVLNPAYYYKLDPFTRKEAIKSLFAIASTGAIISSLGVIMGAKSLGNPFSSKMNWFGGKQPQILSSDFGKVRAKSNQVLDPWGGHQQPIVAAARFMAGRTEVGPQTRSTTAENFAVSKLSPIASLAYELAAAKKWTGGGGFQTRFGQPSSVQMEVGKRFVPIFIQDFNDLVRSDASFAEKVGLTGAAAVGMGVQDYPERTTAKNPRKLTLRP